jgi:anti-sigma factor RsiW
MTDQIETLVQRFLDGELSRPERQVLLRMLGSRPDVRQRLLEDEAMLEEVANLPRATVPVDFVATTMAALPPQMDVASGFSRTEAHPAEAGGHARAFALAAAASLLLAAGFWGGRESARPDAVATVSPEPPATVLVRLVLVDSQAQSVAVAGDFNDWDAARSPLARAEGGVWTAMVPLNAGRYHYMFVVDGMRWVVDPLAVETSRDGFGAENSVLDVEL